MNFINENDRNPDMSWRDFQVCSQLKLPTSLPETGKRGQAGTMGGDKFSLVPQNEDTFSWTQVEDESDLVVPATLKQSLSKSSPKGTPTGVVAVNSLFLQRSL
jgi:hypothetical protein